MKSKKGFRAAFMVNFFLIFAILITIGLYIKFNELTDVATNSSVLKKTNLGSRIETIDGGSLFFTYKDKSVSSKYSSIQIDNVNCAVSGDLNIDLNIIKIENCDSKITKGTHNITIITDNGIFRKILEIKNEIE